jgi:N-acylneuraminate cytidylyltransferase/CMP-N,N'-diacetyllegionaminic acid synthase
LNNSFKNTLKNILTVIPARKGSKGLPGKNIKILIDKPLIAWSIEQALASKYIGDVYVSTDCAEIADVAIKYGAKVPFLRPDFLARDETSTADVLTHLIDELAKLGFTYDYILLLEPTSPLRSTDDINRAYEKLIDSEAKSIVGVSRVESQHPLFCVTIDKDDFIRSENNFKVFRRQEISELYYFEGSIYISEIQTFLEKKNFYHNETIAYKVPKWKAFEIDDEVDFIITEALLKNKNLLEK